MGPNQEECTSEVADVDLEKFTHTHAQDWRCLPPHLEMHGIIVKHLERKLVDERERRYNFFTEWHSQKGSDATYEKLVKALVTDQVQKLCVRYCRRDPKVVRLHAEKKRNPHTLNHQLALQYLPLKQLLPMTKKVLKQCVRH